MYVDFITLYHLTNSLSNNMFRGYNNTTSNSPNGFGTFSSLGGGGFGGGSR